MDCGFKFMHTDISGSNWNCLDTVKYQLLSLELRLIVVFEAYRLLAIMRVADLTSVYLSLPPLILLSASTFQL